jgi:hypothetical protein
VMASLRQTLTMGDSISTPANVLRLNSGHLILDDPFAAWDHATNTANHGGIPMGTTTELGLGLADNDMNTFQQELDYQVEAGLLCVNHLSRVLAIRLGLEMLTTS